MLSEKELASLKHALGMDNKDAVHGIYEAYRRCSVYNEPIKEWDNLVRKGFATKSVDSDNQISYRVTEKGMKKVADATGLMIKYTLEFEPNPDLKNFTLTQEEEKELLLIDLCARLPYGVKIELGVNRPTTLMPIILHDYYVYDANYLPYLRPLSSITKEEEEYFLSLKSGLDYDTKTKKTIYNTSQVDWLNSHHFDYRGLIEKGLAIEAPEDMYKID